MRNIILIASLTSALAACVSDQNLQALREAPGFGAGYGDGCMTAGENEKSFSTKEVRDEYSFDNDEAYAFGWRQGYLECSDRIPEDSDGGRILGERREY